jgi:tRNA A64-2'-O-ribosylphosphate transferase
MPDALSKTIPIWCSVLNHLLFPDLSQYHELYTPPQVVSQSEHAQITALLPSFLASLEILNLSIEPLKLQILKPLRPIWVTPDSNLTRTKNVFEDFHPVICCTVSRRVAGGELSEGGYIQGAGDDTENWAHGLTPSIFWAKRAALLSTHEADLLDMIEVLVRQSTSAGPVGSITCLKPTSLLYVSTLNGIREVGPTACFVSLLPKVTDESTWKTSATRIDVGLGPHKIGGRNLRTALPAIVALVEKYLEAAKDKDENQVILACESGKDLSIGVALTLLCLFFAEDGGILTDRPDKRKIDKTFIRRRLGWISTSMPDANPSRTTLQSVNSFLMERPHEF